ncbi:hypothetical protein FB451DRAFT_1507203 [Mycena latifolia]|nr:hypothetical protein FB451DRAFT_1507203 [Mycena latifolia]
MLLHPSLGVSGLDEGASFWMRLSFCPVLAHYYRKKRWRDRMQSEIEAQDEMKLLSGTKAVLRTRKAPLRLTASVFQGGWNVSREPSNSAESKTKSSLPWPDFFIHPEASTRYIVFPPPTSWRRLIPFFSRSAAPVELGLAAIYRVPATNAPSLDFKFFFRGPFPSHLQLFAWPQFVLPLRGRYQMAPRIPSISRPFYASFYENFLLRGRVVPEISPIRNLYPRHFPSSCSSRASKLRKSRAEQRFKIFLSSSTASIFLPLRGAQVEFNSVHSACSSLRGAQTQMNTVHFSPIFHPPRGAQVKFNSLRSFSYFVLPPFLESGALSVAGKHLLASSKSAIFLVTSPEFIWFSSTAARLPDRVLSGRILDKESDKAVERTRKQIQGKLATYSEDGWTNIAKTHVDTSMLSVETKLHNNSSPFCPFCLTIDKPYLLRTHVPILVATTLMFFVSTFSAVLSLQDVIDAFIYYHGPGGALEFDNTVNAGWKHWMLAVEDAVQVHSPLKFTVSGFECYYEVVSQCIRLLFKIYPEARIHELRATSYKSDSAQALKHDSARARNRKNESESERAAPQGQTRRRGWGREELARTLTPPPSAPTALPPPQEASFSHGDGQNFETVLNFIPEECGGARSRVSSQVGVGFIEFPALPQCHLGIKGRGWWIADANFGFIPIIMDAGVQLRGHAAAVGLWLRLGHRDLLSDGPGRGRIIVN